MVVSYKKLLKILIDCDMKKRDLCEVAGVSTAIPEVLEDIGFTKKKFSDTIMRLTR